MATYLKLRLVVMCALLLLPASGEHDRGKLARVWRLLWKRFFLMVVGAYLVLNIFDSGPLQPRDAAEGHRMLVAQVAIAVMGIWMIVCGVRLKPPEPPGNRR